jgi:cellulose synthase/poly-beta-1,6-N-acetylglucosamine synthase-like glycosyltransferase
LKRNAISDPLRWPSLSIVVPARNEAEVIPWSLRSLLKQDYPGEWEVIVVDDRSEDSTPDVLREWSSRDEHLRWIRIEEPAAPSPKKFALAQGIRLAKGEVILTTDADCRYSASWARGLIRHLQPDVGVVAGLTIFDLPGFRGVAIWQKIQWLDFFVQNFLAAGSLGWGHAASCNGSNLCFRREVFEMISGYGEHSSIISGDDVLFAQRVAKQTAWKVVFAATRETIVRSLPVTTFRDLLHQRLRWASKGLSYRGSMLTFLFGIYMYYLAMLLLPAIALLNPAAILPVAASWSVKTLTDGFVVRAGCKVFGQHRLWRYFVPYEILQAVFVPFFGLAGLLLPYRWKGGWYRTARLPNGLNVQWQRIFKWTRSTQRETEKTESVES